MNVMIIIWDCESNHTTISSTSSSSERAANQYIKPSNVQSYYRITLHVNYNTSAASSAYESSQWMALLLPILIDREVHKEELINYWRIVGVYKEH